jgi:hypothetical protein
MRPPDKGRTGRAGPPCGPPAPVWYDAAKESPMVPYHSRPVRIRDTDLLAEATLNN